MTWRPIETAPKDGTPILVASDHPGFYPRSCWWSQFFDCWVVRERIDDGEATRLDPEVITHWMPLPEPPASGMEAEGRDPKGLGAKPDSPTAEGGDAQ